MYSKIDWDDINYHLNEVKENIDKDSCWAENCLASLGEYVPALIERIQKLARENAELRAELKKSKEPNLGINIDFDKLLRQQEQPRFNHPPTYFRLKQDYQWMPPYLITCDNEAKVITDANSTYRDSM